MRLIDADELIFRLETQDYSGAPDTLEDWTPQDMTIAEIADINKMPTIDAVPVVRCKDCRILIIRTQGGKSVYYCPFIGHYTCETFFCAKGEREENV